MNLRFRKISGDDDLKKIMEWRSKPEVTRYMYTDIESDMKVQKIWFQRITQDPTRKDWIIEANGNDVGLVSLYRIDNTNRRCEWAYYIGSTDVRGMGIGKNVELNILEYVFTILGLNKLCCEVYASNEFVIGLHEKYGSCVEGKRRQHIWKNGEFHDIVEMGILKQEWKNKIKEKFGYTKGSFD